MRITISHHQYNKHGREYVGEWGCRVLYDVEDGLNIRVISKRGHRAAGRSWLAGILWIDTVDHNEQLVVVPSTLVRLNCTHYGRRSILRDRVLGKKEILM